MIPPKAIRLIIRHFDSLDRAVSLRMRRKRPWLEPALTSLLCDLLDGDTQANERLDYPLDDLNHDLGNLDGLLSAKFSVETHEYAPQMERWVTQSDLGLIINVTDHLLPEHSWSIAWLLQAKRLTPDLRGPDRYSESSRFGSIDSAQMDRMERLNKAVGVYFVHFLLYCPRPCFLSDLVRKKLAHLRNSNLTENIFDYSLGFVLHDELGLSESSLSAGVFISFFDRIPGTLAEVHAGALQRCYPLSWFIAAHLVERDHFALVGERQRLARRPRHMRTANDENEEWVRGIVAGDPKAIDRLMNVTGEIANGPFPILPPHTLTINVEIGANLDEERRRIRLG